jgi:hypothetical protein
MEEDLKTQMMTTGSISLVDAIAKAIAFQMVVGSLP